jgi:AP-1-like factor
VQSYEQGEVDKTVGLQMIAKHLKEENDKLRQENRALQTKLAQMENVNKDRSSVEKDKKRWRDDDSPSQSPMKKKSRASSNTASGTYPCLPAFSQTYLPSPSSLVSTPDSNKTNSHFSTLPCKLQLPH